MSCAYPDGLFMPLLSNDSKTPLRWVSTANIKCREAALACLVNFTDASANLLNSSTGAGEDTSPRPNLLTQGLPSSKDSREGERLFAFAMAMCQSSGEDLYALCVQAEVLRACQGLVAEHGDEYAEDLALQALRRLSQMCPWLDMQMGSTIDEFVSRGVRSPVYVEGAMGRPILHVPFELTSAFVASGVGSGSIQAKMGAARGGRSFWALQPRANMAPWADAGLEGLRGCPASQTLVILAAGIVKARGNIFRRVAVGVDRIRMPRHLDLVRGGGGKTKERIVKAAAAAQLAVEAARGGGSAGESRDGKKMAEVWPAEAYAGLGNCAHTLWHSGPGAAEDMATEAAAAAAVVAAVGGRDAWARVVHPIVDAWATLWGMRVTAALKQATKFSDAQRGDYWALALRAVDIQSAARVRAAAAAADAAAKPVGGSAGAAAVAVAVIADPWTVTLDVDLYDDVVRDLYEAAYLILPPCAIEEIFVRVAHPKHFQRMSLIGLLATLDLPKGLAFDLYANAFARDAAYARSNKKENDKKKRRDTVQFLSLFGKSESAAMGGGTCVTRAKAGTCPAVSSARLARVYEATNNADPVGVSPVRGAPRNGETTKALADLEEIITAEAGGGSTTCADFTERRCACARYTEAERLGARMVPPAPEVVLHARSVRVKHPRVFTNSLCRGTDPRALRVFAPWGGNEPVTDSASALMEFSAVYAMSSDSD